MKSALRTAALAAVVVVAAPVFGVLAQSADHGDGHGSERHQGSAMMGPGMMDRGMMGPGMMGQGMMGQHMMGPGRMGRGMMGQHMMGGHMGGYHGVTGHRFGQRVTPAVHLSEDDVRHFFEHRLDRAGHARLKVGDVKQKDDDVIVADIVTQKEGALVERFEVDRHSGRYSQVN
jgi:hypothetical protein